MSDRNWILGAALLLALLVWLLFGKWEEKK